MKEKISEDIVIYNDDAFNVLPSIDSESVDLIVTDPPYFLSNGGISCSNGKMVSVDKGDWDKTSISIEDFYRKFLIQAKRVLKPNGTIWVFGTMHNIYYLGYLLQELEFKLLNNITWQKSNPPPNLSCRMFTHSTETIIWAKKNAESKHFFNYELMKEINGGKQMKDVWTTSTINKKEKTFGKHPTQKPIKIIKNIILASSKRDDLVLDCFMGSGTTIDACVQLGRKAIGIELDEGYFNIAKDRVSFRVNNNQISFFDKEKK